MNGKFPVCAIIWRAGAGRWVPMIAMGADRVMVIGSDTLSRFFFEGRLVEPAGYVNANVALWFAAL